MRTPSPLRTAALGAAALVLGAFGSLGSPGAVAAGRPAVDLRCEAHGAGPLLDCTVRVTRDAEPLVGVQVTLGAAMPSMPMAHSVKPVTARSTGRPGEYRGTLELEMSGVWAVQVDLAGTVRDRVVRALAVEGCEGEHRCPVAPARPTSAGPAHRHSAHH